MILEYFKFLTNPATKSSKKLGQLQESIAMNERYKRSRKQWSSHLENSKILIENTINQLNEKNEVIVLGSGLLLDIPIEVLARKFNQVYLVDVVHLKSVDATICKYPNVETVTHDVTGLSSQILDAQKNRHIKPIASIPKLCTKTSLVISANMLSQLHLAPIKYCGEKLNFDEIKQEKLIVEIMNSHITMLANLPCNVCLITDYFRNYLHVNDNIIEQEDALPGISLPKPDKVWQWEIAPRGEFDKNISLTSEVYGYYNFH